MIVELKPVSGVYLLCPSHTRNGVRHEGVKVAYIGESADVLRRRSDHRHNMGRILEAPYRTFLLYESADPVIRKTKELRFIKAAQGLRLKLLNKHLPGWLPSTALVNDFPEERSILQEVITIMETI